jgi:hypothetical protein
MLQTAIPLHFYYISGNNGYLTWGRFLNVTSQVMKNVLFEKEAITL